MSQPFQVDFCLNCVNLLLVFVLVKLQWNVLCRVCFWGCLLFLSMLRSSFFWKNNLCRLQFQKKWGRLPFQKVEVVVHFRKNGGRLQFSKKLRSSSIFKEIEVVVHFKQQMSLSSIFKNWVSLPFSKKTSYFI